MNALAGLPPSTRSKLRIKDILSRSLPVSADGYPAWSYVQRLGLAGSLQPETALYGVFSLDHWASKAGRMPAILALAKNGIDRALEATFITPAGERAPIKDAKLLLGTLNGASVCLQNNFEATNELWIARTWEAGLRFAGGPRPRNIVAALRVENIPGLTVIAENKPRWINLIADDFSESAPRSSRWLSVANDLRDRGFVVDLLDIAGQEITL